MDPRLRFRICFCSELPHPIAPSKNNNSPNAICTMARHAILCHCLTSACRAADPKMLLRAGYQDATPTAFADTMMTLDRQHPALTCHALNLCQSPL